MSMSENEPLTGLDLWTPNDYSNIITIGAAAVGSVLLIVFKSRCKNIKLCCGVIECIREVKDETDEENQNEEEEQQPAIVPPNRQNQ